MKNKNIVFIMAIFMLSILPTALATTIVINGTNSSIIANPPTISLGLKDWTVIFHLDNATIGRNDVAPGYEYQYAGENVHFSALVTSNSQYAAENMVVTVNMNCPIAGVQIAPLVITSPVQMVGGIYQAQYQGDYIIPASISENCPITVTMNYLTTTATNSLSLSTYTNVNDLLMNPTITLVESSPLAFTLNVNQYNSATPYPQTITITSPVDREAQGVLGDMQIYKTKLTGITIPSYSISADKYRFAIGTGAFNNLVLDSSNNGHSGDIPFTTSLAPTSFYLYWQLWFEATLPSQQYEGSGWYLLKIL
jgi:hypothetical protein